MSRAVWRASSRRASTAGAMRRQASYRVVAASAASASASHSPTPSVRQCEMTKLTPAPPSVNGSAARCHPGPCSESSGVLACSLSQASNSSRGRADATISMSDEPSGDIQRWRPNGNGDRSIRRDNGPR